MRYSKLMLVMVGALCMQVASAAPTPEQAAQLGRSGTTLTPTGAIRAGNKEGTIPEWTGGVCKPPADYKPAKGLKAGGGPFPDLFPDDKPLFKITAENMAQHADKLDDGVKELFKRFPKTFYMNVYPTRRSACFADWVYDNTIKRVMNPKIVGGKIPSLSGAQAQFPFPIPGSGVEAMWNALLVYKPFNAGSSYKTLYIDPAGGVSITGGSKSLSRSSYWNNSIAMLPDDGRYAETFSIYQYPASQRGFINMQRRMLRPDLYGDPTWTYTPGLRRVRLSPEATYDGVAPVAGGTFLYDEGSGFQGKMDKFDFKLIGRKEMYVPYNNVEAKLNRDVKVARANHLDPEAIRYELHRVWHVVATLRPGERHVQQKKVFYIDEDSWQIASYQGFDQSGKVHHFYSFQIAQFPDRPAVTFHCFQGYDMSKNAYTHWAFSGDLMNTEMGYGTYEVPPIPDSSFTPEGMVAAGVR